MMEFVHGELTEAVLGSCQRALVVAWSSGSEYGPKARAAAPDPQPGELVRNARSWIPLQTY